MSRIDELIHQLCPDGVELKALGKVGQFIRGNGLQKVDLREEGVPAVHYGQIHTHYGVWTTETKSFTDGEIAAKLRHARPGDLLIATTSEDDDAVAKATAWLGNTDVVLSGDAYIYRHDLDPKYVSYFFQSTSFQDQKRRFISGTKVRRVSGDSLAKIQIPVPPLEVQREIVRILDQFTQLEAELEAELEARRRQYEHYRQLAMSFDDSVPRVALGDVAEVRSGWGFPNAHQGQEEGEYPFYKVSDMNLLGNETVMSIANHYVSAEVAKKLGVRPAPAGTVIFPKIGAAVATNKKRVLSVPSAYDNNVMGLVPTGRVSSRFLYHWMQTFDLSRLANDSGAVPSIRKTEAEQVLIPLPDLDTQRKVADLLDKFDALVNDLNVGLPAELAARRKQYEYYRDKLLTFKEAAA